MTHSFARFGLDHLSPSSLNAWIYHPGIWAEKYLNNNRDKDNPAIWRGRAVEDGVHHLLMGKPLNEATAAAHNSFDLNSLNAIDEEGVTDEYNLIAPMLEQATKWNPPSELAATQVKIEHFFEGVYLPVIGWLDLAFLDGIDVDLKTTTRCPSSIATVSKEHIRQVSLYRAARGRRGGLLYLTDKKYAYFDIDDETMQIALATLHRAALTLQYALTKFSSKEDMLKAYPVDWDNFRAPKTRVPLSEILLAG